MSTLKREYQRHLSEQTRELEDATGQRDQTQHRMDEIIREKAAVDIELKALRERATILMEDAERMRRQNHSLLQESADKDMKIAQADKQHAQDKEDIYGLNVALDSKQQELELIKRKMGVRGTAGSTPAPASKVTQHRRDSSIFSATPLSGPASRPSSALSQTDTESNSVGPRKERKLSGEIGQSVSARVTALGKSTRVNTFGGTVASATGKPSTSGRASVDSSMGPPASKPRPSIATPTPTGRVSSLTRSFSANKIVTPQSVTPMPHRRGSSAEQNTPSQRAKVSRPSVAASPAPSSVAEVDEKENIVSPVKKRTMIPVPA
ncbi:hypothetical protein HYPSUDRAFT_145897 [Hypholoma sublateritium FD-334 SS-4]|uniref:Uncharacterized protein n=1 Tax=Hypholoma sublateritium (strain FD-334 SS-4) TaxID=945553 RepID=A0A0D2M3T4_HYPSF|nr:hypothetical protein HYPSUDRAFT_145897 [Hypholoma sublateritium FD-334 SS-4]